MQKLLTKSSTFGIVLVLYLLFYLAIHAQSSQPLEARVVKNAALRVSASENGKVITRLAIGTRLLVIPSVTPGWFVVRLKDRKSTAGFLHGNFIKLESNSSLHPDRQNALGNSDFSSKAVILDVGPEKKDVQQQGRNNRPAGSNYCKSSLFCPDIEEVFTTLVENENKLIKGKFEKTADWERRRANLGKETAIGTHNLTEKIYFLYDYLPKSPVPTEWEYDADREMWNFEFQIEYRGASTCIPVLSPKSGTQFCLIVAGGSPLSKNASMAMTPAKASQNDKSIQLAFGGYLVEPFVSLDGIFFKLEDLVGVNLSTGEHWKVNLVPPAVLQSQPVSPLEPFSERSEIDSLKRQLIKDPQNAHAFVDLGKKFLATNDLDNAIRAFSQAIEWDSNSFDAQFGLAKTYSARGETTKAIEHLDIILSKNSDNKEAFELKESITDSTGRPANILVAKPLEGKWNMILQSGTQNYPVELSIFRDKSKLKGALVIGNARTKVFNLYRGTTGDLRFEVSANTSYFQRVKLRFYGTYDGFSIAGNMTILQGLFEERAALNSLPRP
ncbi:MAG: tetratricopeptide repeat protein [Acidobacteria bacterium]|nr:tetratricopeptide repeat protein [Acidobacteriota bacterium]